VVIGARYLLDTNAVSEACRVRPNDRLVEKLRTHHEEIAIAAPVWHELRFGCFRLPPSRKRELNEQVLEGFILSSFPILSYDRAAAEWHAAERARLTLLGKTPPQLDGQIAAVAKVNGLILVTRNLADFKEFQGLTLESWHG
jgi:tRNA(fMet)-specific endonuclease VapC